MTKDDIIQTTLRWIDKRIEEEQQKKQDAIAEDAPLSRLTSLGGSIRTFKQTRRFILSHFGLEDD